MWSCHRFSKLRLNHVLTVLRTCSNGEIVHRHRVAVGEATVGQRPPQRERGGVGGDGVDHGVLARAARLDHLDAVAVAHLARRRPSACSISCLAAAADRGADTVVGPLVRRRCPRRRSANRLSRPPRPMWRTIFCSLSASFDEREPDVHQPRDRQAEEERSPQRVLPDVAHLVVLAGRRAACTGSSPWSDGIITFDWSSVPAPRWPVLVTACTATRRSASVDLRRVLQHDVVAAHLGDGVDDLLARVGRAAACRRRGRRR